MSEFFLSIDTESTNVFITENYHHGTGLTRVQAVSESGVNGC